MDWKQHIRYVSCVSGRPLADDVVEELSQHAELVYDAARAAGRSDSEARTEGEALLVREVEALLNEPWRRTPLASATGNPPDSSSSAFAGILLDVRYAVRMLRRQPGFTIAVILTMALGIGSAVTLFSIAYGVLLKPLPWPEADRLVRVEETRGANHARTAWTITNATYNAWNVRPSTVEEIGAWGSPARMTLAGAGDPARVSVTAATPSLFAVLQAKPLLGRLFDEKDTVGNGGRGVVAILSYGLWQQRFGGNAAALGRLIQIDDRPYTVVGVMPRDFEFPDSETRMWTPMAIAQVVGQTATGGAVIRAQLVQALARLRPGVTPLQAAAEGTARARSAPDLMNAALALFGATGAISVGATPVLQMMTAQVRPAILVLLAAASLLFLTALGSAVSVQLARATTRRRETAIRIAIGAGAGRLVRQWLIESVVLGACGGIGGLLFVFAAHRALPRVLPADFPRVDSVHVDVPVLLFAVGVAAFASVVCGLLPALQTRRVDVSRQLMEGGNSPEGGSLRTPVARARSLIMAGQVAVACVLLVGAGLLARSFVELRRVDRGYDPSGLLTARLPFPRTYPPERRIQILEALQARMKGVAGVTETAFSNGLPFVAAGGVNGLQIPSPDQPGVTVDLGTTWQLVSEQFFDAMRVHVSQGRPLTATDTESTQPVIVVNRAFAKYLGANPTGRHLQFSWYDRSDWEVVGVVDDMQEGVTAAGPSSALDAAVQRTAPQMFFSYRQIPKGIAAEPVLVVRTLDEPSAYAATLGTLLREQDPSLAFDSVMTMDARVSASLATPRLYAGLIVGFGLFALTIAAIGLFGVLSYSVAQRTREIGLRSALGAPRGSILRLILRQGMTLTLAGVAGGLFASTIVVRSLARLLYGVTTHDVVSFVIAPAILLVVALLACAIPAMSAVKIDPLRALKSG